MEILCDIAYFLVIFGLLVLLSWCDHAHSCDPVEHDKESHEMKRRPYVKPAFRRAHGIDFVLASIANRWSTVCRQCSSCHGCR